MASGARRSGLVLAAVVLVLVGGVVAALTLGGGDGEEADGGTPTASTSTSGDDGFEEPEPEETDTSAPPEGIEPFTPTSALDLERVCERTGVVEGADPFPAGAGGRGDAIRAFTFLQQPDVSPPMRNGPEWELSYTPTGATATDVPPYAPLNAVVCIDAVKDSAVVRSTCQGTGDLAGETWEVWSSDFVFRTIDPSTGAIVDESEPFFSGDIALGLDPCATPLDDVGGLRDLRESDADPGTVGALTDEYFASLVGG